MCEAASIAAGIAAVAGAGASIYGAQQQKAEYARARAAQERADSERKAVSMLMRNENDDFSKKRNEEIIKEAAEVAPMENRPQLLQQAEDTRTQSNINAMQAANALGEAAIERGAEGDHSEAYTQARARTAANQTERAVKLARLFGAQDAAGDALMTQHSNALNPRLMQGALGAQRNSMNRGYDWVLGDIGGRAARDTQIDPSKGAMASSLGGAALNWGLSGIGGQMGEAGWGAKPKPYTKAELASLDRLF